VVLTFVSVVFLCKTTQVKGVEMYFLVVLSLSCSSWCQVLHL